MSRDLLGFIVRFLGLSMSYRFIFISWYYCSSGLGVIVEIGDGCCVWQKLQLFISPLSSPL